MATKTIYDSNIWLASMISNDSLHQKAITVIRENSNPIVITHDIIAEVITVLKKLKKTEQAKVFVNMVDATRDIELVPSASYYQTTIEYFLNSNDTKLSFVDMSLVVLSTQYIIETFDKSLKAEIKALQP